MSNGTPWWGTLLASAIAALAAIGGVGISTWRQNKRARREEWFRRLQWAEELRNSPDENRRAAGAAVLATLASSDLATADDLRLVEDLSESPQVDALVEDFEGLSLDTAEFVEDTGDEDQEAREGEQR